MLAILTVKMEWDKGSRTPEGSEERKEYLKPVIIDDSVNLVGEGIFLKQCLYYQKIDGIISASKAYDELNNKQNNTKGEFSGIDWKKERRLKDLSKKLRQESGVFVREEDLDIPYISIEKSEDNSYRIKWYDYGMGMPRRRGGNEDFCKAGKKLKGQPNILNETAFILKEGESGVLKYNYRCTYYNGQWYVCYYVYIVNYTILTHDIFLRTYDYEYNRLADLF